MSHEDGARVPDHLGQVREGAAVVEVKVRDDDAVQYRREITFPDVREVRELALVLEAHVHPAVEHDVLASHLKQEATPADVLAGAWSEWKKRTDLNRFEIDFPSYID